MDLSIEGKIYHNGTFETACLGITDGTITAIKKTLRADTHLDYGTHVLLPGGIDLHVHLRDPGHPKKEDFQTGTTAAVFGGITTLFDMPNTNPPTTTLTTLKEKHQIAQRKSLVDYGIYTAVTEHNLTHIPTLAPHCSGFKIFLGNSTNATSLPTPLLNQALQIIQPTKKRTLIHAEDERCLEHATGQENTLADHNQRRPARCEETAIHSLLSTDIETNVHICHLSSQDGLAALHQHPSYISVGATPHHLLLDSTLHNVPPTWLKVNPPLRTPTDRMALWQSLIQGEIDIVESDHAPHTLEEKEQEFGEAPSGMPGIETMYPLFLALVKQKRLDLARVLRLLCERPAELAGLPKGRLEVNRDADLIVVDLKTLSTISSDLLHTKCGWTAFEGHQAIFPTAVFLRGNQILDGDQLLGRPGDGRSVLTMHNDEGAV